MCPALADSLTLSQGPDQICTISMCKESLAADLGNVGHAGNLVIELSNKTSFEP